MSVACLCEGAALAGCGQRALPVTLLVGRQPLHTGGWWELHF